MRRSTFRYLLYLILCRSDLKELRSRIWRKRSLHLSLRHFNSHGTIYLHPLNLLNKGLLYDQIVQVVITYRTSQGAIKQTERLLVVKALRNLSLTGFVLGDSDRFNIFGSEDVVVSAKLESIKPYGTLPKYQKVLYAPDTVRVSPLKQYNSKITASLGPSLQKLLRTSRIVYKGDIILLETAHELTEEIGIRAVKVDYIGDSPCILDQRCSLFEVATVSTAIPNGGFTAPKFALPSPMNSVLKRMRDLYFAFQAVEEVPLVLALSGASGSGKKLLCERFAAATHQNFIDASSYDSWSEVSAQTEQKLKHLVEKAKNYQPCILYFSQADVLGYDPNSSEPGDAIQILILSLDRRIVSTLEHLLSEPARVTIILSCNSDNLTKMAGKIKSLALYEFAVPHLDENDRHFFLSQFMEKEDAVECSRNTSGFSLAELFSLIEDIEYSCQDGAKKAAELIEKAIDKRNAEFADSIGAPKIPSVSWSDVGGLEDTKQLVIESIEANLHGDDNLRRSGIILFGPPGCGKTLIAKAVATEFKIAFLSVKGPELLNKYVGQSEENLRKVFERARQASPCVIFFDEIDSLAPNRGRSGDSGGVMDRIVSQLLAEMDDLLSDPQCKVFVMAATNRADLLDPSLLTAGRFDKVVNVSPGTSVETKKKILTAVCRKVKLDPDADLEEIAEKCPKVISGAELYSVVSTATMAALRDKVHLVDSGKIKLAEARVTVSRKHLLSALDNIQLRTNLR